MIRSLWIAKTGLDAQQTQMDTISHNLANVGTNGYKRSHAVFEDLIYQNLRQAGSQSTANTTLPTGLQLLVYPLEDSLLIGVGFEAEQGRQIQAEAVLRKRSWNLERYGAWLPAQLLDGSWYVVRRLQKSRFLENGPLLPNSALLLAQELLA